MCLVIIGWKTHPDFPLVVAANRDEIHIRASASAHFWDDYPQIYAGRDIDGGGTWLGITRTGRFAAVTNYRNPELYQDNRPSRGLLVQEFLVSSESALAYAARLQECAANYNPFNLLICDTEDMVWLGYVPDLPCQVVRIQAGIHGVSNHLLNTPWPKLIRAKIQFRAGLAALPNYEAMRRLLQARRVDENEILVANDLDPAILDMMSSAFVVSDDYGTRSSTILTRSQNGQIFFEEIMYNSVGIEAFRSRITMDTMEV